ELDARAPGFHTAVEVGRKMPLDHVAGVQDVLLWLDGELILSERVPEDVIAELLADRARQDVEVDRSAPDERALGVPAGGESPLHHGAVFERDRISPFPTRRSADAPDIGR